MRPTRQLAVTPVPAHCACRRAFTLIELLVVIAVVALLISILLPSLQRVRKQAKATRCQSNIRQAGLYLAVYAAENDGKLDLNDSRPWEPVHYYDHLLVIAGRSWERKDVLLCPMASQPEFTGVLNWYPAKYYALGNTFAAWRTLLTMEDHWSPEPTPAPHVGSYGLNNNLLFGGIGSWNARATRGAAGIPVYLDCVYFGMSVGTWLQEPPPYEGCFNNVTHLGWSCINRHDGGVNCVFYDWSVRKVGLKELWTLKWRDGWDTAGPWTKRGGVKPEDWPEWMRRFKDY